MIRICSINLKEENNDTKISYNVRTDKLTETNFTIIGLMLDEKNNEVISNQLKEYNTYYYDGRGGRLEKYLREYRVKHIIIGINLNNIKTERDVKKYISKIKKLSKICRRCKTMIGILGEEAGEIISIIIFNYRENLNIKNIKLSDLIDSTKLEMYRSKKQRYNYIYDKACAKLDYEFQTKNLCDFKDNKCIEKRRTNVICGCCRHYRNLFSKKLIKCKYLKNKKCTAKCITCKMFTCDTLQKQGIKFRIRDFYLLNYYLNPMQKLIIKASYFTTKDKILRRLMRLGN